MLSRIVAMNFAPLTNRCHSYITGLSHSYRSLSDYISHHSLHPHSCSRLSRCTCSLSSNHTHTIYTLDILSHPAEYCLACLLTKRFPCIPSLISCVLIPACVPDLFSPPSPLDIVCRSPTHACPRITLLSCPCHTCLLLPDPACIDHVV